MPSNRRSPTPEAEAARVWNIWEKLHENPPKVLFHYTAADGLLGMLQNRAMWATHVRFMNDTSEMAYGIEFVRESCREYSDRLARSNRKLWNRFQHFEKMIRLILDDSQQNTKHYLVCFCTKGNLLSQWRGYGASGGGYALGFPTKDLPQFEAEFLPDSPVGPATLGVFLRRVIYKPSVQRSVVRRCLNAAAKHAAYQMEHRKAPNPEEWLSLPLARTIYECLVCFKHPGFSEEQEWRLIQQGRVSNTDVCKQSFRSKSGRIVSFATLTYRANETARRSPKRKSNHFPISSITYGPTLDTEASERALQLLLQSYGFSEGQITIVGSGIPFRA
jgi:hypothetical protein